MTGCFIDQPDMDESESKAIVVLQIQHNVGGPKPKEQQMQTINITKSTPEVQQKKS